MNEPWKGGKGKKAQYSTTHTRVPDPIKPVVEMLAREWKRALVQEKDTESLLIACMECIHKWVYPNEKPLTGKGKTDKDIALELLNEYLGEAGIPLDEKGKPKARYDQLAKFKSWLEKE